MRPTDAVVESFWPSEYDARNRGFKKKLALPITFETHIYPHDFLKSLSFYVAYRTDARLSSRQTSAKCSYARSPCIHPCKVSPARLFCF